MISTIRIGAVASQSPLSCCWWRQRWHSCSGGRASSRHGPRPRQLPRPSRCHRLRRHRIRRRTAKLPARQPRQALPLVQLQLQHRRTRRHLASRRRRPAQAQRQARQRRASLPLPPRQRGPELPSPETMATVPRMTRQNRKARFRKGMTAHPTTRIRRDPATHQPPRRSAPGAQSRRQFAIRR